MIVGASSSYIYADGFASGTGTKADPYIISNATELKYFVEKYHNSYSYYKITADIDLGNYEFSYNTDKIFYGHLIGEKEDGSKPIIRNYKINVPNNNKSHGLLGTVYGAEIRNIRVSDVTMSSTNDISNAVRVGGFIGNVEKGSLVEGCSAENITVSLGATKASLYCGGLIGRIGNEYSVVRNCSVNGYTLTISGVVTVGGNFAPLVGRMDCGSLVEDCSTENIKITTRNSLTGPNLSGLVGSMYGTNSTNRAVITRCSVKDVTISLEGGLGKIGIGSIVGWAGSSGNGYGYSDITRCKTTGLKVYMSGDLNAASVTGDIRLGGMVGKLEKDCKVTDCLLYESVSEYGKNYIGSNPNVNVNKTFCRNICMYVGGVVGSSVDQGTTSPGNKIVIDCCVAYCDFDFTGYKSVTTGNLSKNNFVIGGVIGRLYNPYYIPKTLYYSGKVKAPYCVVGPLVGTFLKSKDSNDFIYKDYSGMNNANATAASYDNWFYGDYQIWINDNVFSSGKTRNGGYTAEGYATIGDVGTWTANMVGGNSMFSKTILQYTTNANYIGSEANIDEDLTICPNYSENTNYFPEYYMYYAQGVNRGTYQSNINNVLDALRGEGDSPIWDVDASGNIVMDKFKATENMKTTDAFTSVLSVISEDGSPLPSGYTYDWKDGDTPLGSGASIEVARGMEPRTATVYISKSSTIIGTHTVTIPRREWFDKGAMASSAPVVGDGSEEHPYEIATPENLAWMGYHISVLGTKNTEHYVLTKDIDLADAWWTPINGLEELGVGSFAGVFEGNTHSIKNLKIDWDTNYGLTANFGLFSVIEGASDTQRAVVRNLVIDHATVSKETNATVAGDRRVGILAGNIKQYSNIENVIVRNSEVRASNTSSSQNGKSLLFGGLAGQINDNVDSYGFLNISTGVNIALSKLTVNSSGNVVVGGVIAQWQANARTCVTNVYALGSINVPSGLSNVGSVFGKDFSGLTDAVKATIFYVNSASQNVGTKKELAEYANTFLESANEKAQLDEDLFYWVYSQGSGYDLSITGLKVSDNNWQEYRFGTHEMEVVGSNLDAYTYSWLLNGKKVSTSTTYYVKPIVPDDNTTLVVEVTKKTDGTKSTIRVSIPTGRFEGQGTSVSPYLIGCPEELQLLSYLSNQVGTYLYDGKTSAEYNKAYYKLDNNVTFPTGEGAKDFTPIGSVKDNYQAENCFRGHFDGRGKEISNLKITWFAGDVDAEVNRVWGLFGAVQGISTSQKAVIQNLIIKDAKLTHKTANSSFYYDNGTSGKGNNCYVGVLAGLVGANATIQNIEVAGCSITDPTSPADGYNIANHTLSVGGIIGRAQYSFSSDGDMNASTVIRLLSSDCNITIENAKFNDPSTRDNTKEYKINVAGIIGSMRSTGASGTMPWPSYTYYTGQVKAVGKAMVSPVFSCAEFRNNTNYNYENYCNLYVGRINKDDTAPVSNVFYGSGYQIYYNSAFHSINDAYPAHDDHEDHRNPCDMEARTIVSHSYLSGGLNRWQHRNNYNDYYYQGVNYGVFNNASNRSVVISAYNEGRNNSNNSEIKSFGFSFGDDGKLHLGEVFDIVFTDNHLGDAAELEHTLTLENKLDDSGLTYKWFVNGEEKPYSMVQKITLGVTPQLVCVKVYRGDEVEPRYTTDVIELPRGYSFSADYTPKDEFTGTYTVTPNATFTAGGYSYDYVWKEYGESGKVELATGTSANKGVLTGANQTKVYYCTLTATDDHWKTFVTAYENDPLYKDLIPKYKESFTTELTVRYIEAVIVFLHTNGEEEIDGVTYPAGSDDADGKTDQTPVKTWQKAYSLLNKNGSWDENKIVLIGTSNREATCNQTDGNKGFSITANLQGNSPSEEYSSWKKKVDDSHLAKNVTITGKHADIDYHGTIEAYEDGSNGVKYIGLFGDTRFEYITFNHDTRAKHSSYLFCQYHNLEMGEGIKMTGFTSNAPGYGTIDGAKTASFQIYGGLNNDSRFRKSGGILDMKAMEDAMPHGKEGFSITLKSGHYSCVTVAGRQSSSDNRLNGLMGTPNMPIKCTVTIDIDREWNNANNEFHADYDCGIVAASHEGAMYADMDIIIKSGYVARVVNGMLGNQKPFKFTYNGQTYDFPDNTYMGRANILIDPKEGNDGYVKITELYGGSTGRGYQNGITIVNPFYGYSTVTINGGTFTILPEGNTQKANIFCGIFGAGAGGYNGIGDDAHPTVDQNIAYWNADKTVVLYGDYEAAKDNLVSAYCYNKDGSETEVDPALTNTKILIKGGVFGSATQPIDGIYAGGSGFMSPSLFYDKNVVPSIYGGNIYGKTGQTVSTLTIEGGTFYCERGIFAGGRGTDKYYSENAYSGTPANYTLLGLTYGDVELNINGGTIYGNVYGGGAGVAEAKLKGENVYGTLTNMARLTGNPRINIGGSAHIAKTKDKDNREYGGNVYGGGMLAAVDGATTIKISGNAEIDGNVYGAAQGITNDVTKNIIPNTTTSYHLYTSTNAKLFGIVNGNTTITTSDTPTIHGAIYGGAESAITKGNTSITLNGVTLDGDVYGGGFGAVNGSDVLASADVYGNTYIRIDKADYLDATKDYSVYGGGNIASKIGDKENNVGGKTEIVINGCTTVGQMTLYGGGFGAKTSAENTYITVNEFDTEGIVNETTRHYGLKDIYGGGYAGPVYGKTNIALNGGQIFGDVFGGGNEAPVGTECPASGDEKTQYLNTYASRYGTEVSMYGVGPIIYGDIYGGGNKASVYGNTSLSVSNGTFAGEIFGGGQGDISGSKISSDVIGSTNVYVSGVTVIWNKKWNSHDRNIVEWNGIWSGTNRERFINGTQEKPVFINKHNVYGGGNKACKVLAFDGAASSGIATVELTRGFCGIDLLSTDVWKRAYSDNENPHYSVFGGGYGAYTSVGSTKVRVCVDELPSLGGATTDQQLAKSADLTLESEGKADRSNARRKSEAGADVTTIGVYDDSYGVPGLTVHSVIGGGYAGIVEGNTDVTVGGNTFMHRVFGGGYGQLAAYKELSEDAKIDGGVKTRENLGEVGGNATVVTDGGYIYGDLFGGGAGVESAEIEGVLTDFKDMGRVKGSTSVTVSGDTQIFGSVYGGGDVANVGIEGSTPTGNPESASSFDSEYNVTGYTHDNAQSFVHIIGGDIFGQVFAGGNGRMNAKAADYTKLGRVEGHTLVHVADGDNVPYIWDRIFGGCSYGTVSGSALVHIEGGMLGNSIFGGGYGDAADDRPAFKDGTGESRANGSYANVLGDTKVVIDGGTWLWNQKADLQGDITVWTGASQVVAGSLAEIRAMSAAERTAIVARNLDTRFVSVDTKGNLHFTNEHNIFGGGMNACFVGGTAVVSINHSPLGKLKDAEGNVINMLDETTVGGLCWYASVSNTANPQFSVFGGGYGMNTKVGTTMVDVLPGVSFRSNGATIMPESEGGKKPYAYMWRDYLEYEAFEDALFVDYGSVTQEEKIKMYGSSDGSDSDVRTFLRYRASRLAMSLGVPNFTFMNIHGGGFSGYVAGDALVITDGQLACRNVFGGGLGSVPESPTGEETYGEVGGDAGVYLHSGIVSLNVFGGGAGVESIDKDKDGTIDTDFPYIARVKGKTEVEVYGEAVSMPSDVPNPNGEGYLTYDMERVLVYGGVYGGGDVACVGTTEKSAEVIPENYMEPGYLANNEAKQFTTSVSIYGASILSASYAGGNGRVKAKCSGKDAHGKFGYQKLGAVYGNTRFYVEETIRAYPYKEDTEPLENAVIPYLWNRVYGGCQNGTVYGNTLVDLKGGYFAYNIFGGGWGNVDSLTVDGVTVANPDGVTSADVTGNTNILIRGGEAKVTSLWNESGRCWTEAKLVNKNGEMLLYSPQYDPAMKKFTVNHNIYGGGRTACVVKGDTYVNMSKGMLLSNREMVSGVSTTETGGFFNTNEWTEVYHKTGSPHFCVLGGGYGENTIIEHDTHVNVHLMEDGITEDGKLIKDAPFITDFSILHTHFYTRQSVMDVIGGGYSGIVRGTTHVNVGGETFLRRVFGGGFYAPVGAVEVNIKRIDCNDIFGGGLMGDVGFTDETKYCPTLATEKRGTITLNIGTDTGNDGESIWIHKNVYGGNDVSGDVLTKTTLNISAGHVNGNVYGAGNGDYLYAVGRNKEKQVTVNEYYKVGKNTYDLVYTVPSRKFMTSIAASTAAQRMVNCSSYRPKVQNVEINLKGYSEEYPLVLGGVFGGGNSATVGSIDGKNKPSVKIKFDSNLKIENAFMGCDGEAMFDGSEKYRKAYEDLNSLHLEDEIDWVNEPGNHAISLQYLPVAHANRPKIYPHLLDLYFQSVEMDIQPEVSWPGSNITIGSFYCGGNRGNMNVEPDENGRIVNYVFPANLVITDKIVGGCNMANYVMPNSGVLHKGGYLLGVRGKNAINLGIQCKFDPKVGESGVKEGGNVFGGCYTSGTIDGDVKIDIKSDMLEKVTSEEIAAAKAKDIALCNVYGAGYGSLAYVRGNTHINFGQGVGGNGTTANFIYGGGQQGCLVGNSYIRIYNGHIASSICGASYSGLMWGSTHVLVGDPTYYTVNKSGEYKLQRVDKWNNSVKNADGTDVVKKSIFLLEGDIISEEVYDAIYHFDTSHSQTSNGEFTEHAPEFTAENWNSVDIKIDDAIYGGGYVLASGSSVTAGTYTVKKYNNEENLNEYFSAQDLSALGANGTKGFGGNTTVLVWDAPTGGSYSTDHITVSPQTMKEKTGLSDTDDISGYYFMCNGNYKYIYREEDDDTKYTITSTDDFFSDAEKRGDKIIVYEYNAEGGMYGDGRLSFAEGFRSGELYGYGFAEKTPEYARIINSFQRMDMLRLTDCAVMLLGARDYNVSEISATPYSIARVGEIQMVAQNVTGMGDGTLAAMSAKKSRNYLGLSNNIHYCGAIYSNVAFTDKYRKVDGTIESTSAPYISYIDKKQYYITNYKNSPDEFKQRNGGTAANMIGIASGYALKIQNTKALEKGEEIFYGPVVGVVEIALVNVRANEGGGYVYAKNIHTRNGWGAKRNAPRKDPLSTDAPVVTGSEDFLQTSGNFVFQNVGFRYIVDDCFSHGYDKQQELAVKDEIHYWYVTGTHYFYNTTITGYTYDSSDAPLKFNSDNSDALMNLVGTPSGSAVKLKKVTWRSAHSTTDGFEDELEVRNTRNNLSDVDHSGNPVNGKYQLVIGATKATTYDGLYDYTGITPETQKGAYYANVPFTSTESATNFVGTTEIDAANIVLQLADNADNSTTEYYKKHLSEPCLATIDLETTVGGIPYTYTIYLTINYVQGPNVTGTVNVANCALPGEMIEINKGSIQLASDHSMAQSATIYRIGPRVWDEDSKKWHFKKDTNGDEIYYTYWVGNPYQKELGDENATSEMLAGVVYDESNTTNPSIRVPAYYFMNGYGVEYCFKVYGLDKEFAVPMVDDSKLVVHNYHRMEPRRSGGGTYEGDQALDLHIDLAAQRAAENKSDLPEPRIYIEDDLDLKKFASFINEKTNEDAEVGSKNDFGANMQFIMQDNVTISSGYVTPDNFKGTFHGNGHAITGLDNNASMFKEMSASSNIYNLGLVSGNIVSVAPEGSSETKNEHLHCCYEYGQNTVYRMDGTAFKGYTKNDWRYGKVAYDLNQYYLNMRYVTGDNEAANAQNYVEKYYENGDYLYAGYASENHFNGSEFIRNSYIPNYGYSTSAHDMTHPVDVSRAEKDDKGEFTGNYKPQFFGNNIEDGKPKNDYFFFGQVLDAVTKNSAEGVAGVTVPASITLDEAADAFNIYEDMSNRVYRAGGYYGSKNNDGYYYNSSAYVHSNGITAIDFYGYNGQNFTDGSGSAYYYPVSDYGLGSIAIDADVTRNLLLYACNASDRTGVLAEFNYTDGDDRASRESAIRAHIIDQAATPTTSYLHLVERTADNKDSEGGDCFNNDFNCPIPFYVTNRAWYTRVPRYYAANKNDAWEGISLPFSVNRVEASFSGEISHFYGATNAEHAANEASEANVTNAGHEYWLRGLTNIESDKATFSRPGAGLFTGGNLTGNYGYFNSHYAEIYGDVYEDGGMSIYNSTRWFNDYYFQQSYVPYIVSFPGAAFKEFDLSGDFNQALALGDHGVWDADNDTHGFSFREEATKPQNVTFSWYCVNANVSGGYKVGGETASNLNLIGITDDAVTSTKVGSVIHRAAFSAKSDDDIYGMDGYGTAFDSYNRSVLPFRTYMTVASSAKAFAKPQSILIYEGRGIEELPQAEEEEIDGLRIYSKDRKIYVESPTALSLSLYTATGQLVRVFDVIPGTNTYSGFANGIYIVGKKKLYVK